MNNILNKFGMTKVPFTNEIECKYLYKNEEFRESLERLKYASSNNLFLILTSLPGCGKSTLLRTFKNETDPRENLVLYLSESKLTPRLLYNLILRQLGEKEYLYRGDGKRKMQEKFAVIKEMEKKRITIAVDEAHLLPLSTLQELRFFLNTNIDSNNPVSLILSGQNELLLSLKRDALEAVKQRVNIKTELHPLDISGVKKYITSHLKYAGIEKEIFTEEAIDLVSSSSKGIMRVINQICYSSLIAAASLNLNVIDKSIVKNVIETELI